MGKRFLCALIFVLTLAACVPCFAGDTVKNEPPKLPDVQMALLYEESTDTLLYVKNQAMPNPPASMTKVMTALLVLESDPDLSGTAVVSPAAVSEEYCNWMDTFHLVAGEEISVRDLMDYLLIVSGNEAATTLAEYIAGDIPAFIGRMNQRARELGMTHTHYEDPHGLSDLNITTCEDMLILCRYAMQNPTFREIVAKTDGILPPSNLRKYPYHYITTNCVMFPRNVPSYESGFSDDIVGIKTGSTDAAGYNLSCCMKYGDMTFYSIVMHGKDVTVKGASRLGSHIDTIGLLKYARTFRRTGFAAREPIALSVKTKGSLRKNLTLRAKDELYILTQSKDDPLPAITLDKIGKTVNKGDVMGYMTLTDDFGNVRKTELIAGKSAKAGFFTSVTGIAVIAVVITAAAVIAIVLLRRRKRNL